MKAPMYKMKKTGKVCTAFPWGSHKLPQPWPLGYERVIIPVSPKENTNKKCHIQIVNKRNLELVQEPRLRLG